MEQLKRYLETNPVLQPAVVGFFKKGDNVLLGKRIKVESGLGVDRYSGIGGKVGDEERFKDETPEEAFLRETEEEVMIKKTGIKIQNLLCMGRVRFLFPRNTKWNLDTSVYLVEKWQGEPQETDVMKPEWFHIDAMPYDKMFGDNYLWVPKVLNREKINAIIYFDSEEKIFEYVFEEVPVK